MDLIEFTRYASSVGGGVRLGLAARSSRAARGGSTVARARDTRVELSIFERTLFR